ncbi:MAG: substrate-binding periplasmic protein [Limisphaerales bacterium]
MRIARSILGGFRVIVGFCIGIFAILGCPVAGTVHAADAAAPLKVGVSPVFPPMVFKRGRDLVGVEIDLARALGAHLQRPIQIVEVPWKDQIGALNEGRTDIIMSSMSVTPARGFVVAFTQPYLVVGQMALVRRTDKALYALGFPLPPPGKVGVLKATTGEFLVQRDFIGASIQSFTESASAAKALMRERIDLFVSDSTLVWHLAGVHSGDGLTVVPIALSEEQLAWAVRKEDETLRTAANEYLDQSTKDGSLQKVLRRWMAVGP